MTSDERLMRRAIEISRNGFPAPNPHVGCVLVHDGEIVGEGFHDHAGGPHAEVVALRNAGERARGATAYVTLEPCNHFGRTPPCSRALIEAGVSRVVVASPEVNASAEGGLARLRAAGIPTEAGVLAGEAEAANVQFMTAVRRGRPYVVVKAAAGLDGRIALPSGESQWITGPEARNEGHRLRAELGAVLVGRRTVELDDPQLTARIPGVVNPPVRIVLDPQGRLNGKERVFDTAAPTRHITGSIHLPELLMGLFTDGITGILVEGGGTTIAHFIKAGLVDAYELFLAPKILGDGPAWVQGLELSRLADAPALKVREIRSRGEDIQLSLVADGT